MTENKGDILLPIARAAISRVLHIPMTSDERAPWLKDAGACFVTLTQNNQLRGCIGSLEAHRPLIDDVKINAVHAALHDSRFAPLDARELGATDIEISLLTPAQTIQFQNEADALSQLRPGKDGVIFEFGRNRSTFLPQVWEQLPKPEEFMAQLKRKAGLPADFWADAIMLSRYTVTKYSERDLKQQTASLTTAPRTQ